MIEEYDTQWQKIALDYEIEGLYLHPNKKQKLAPRAARKCRFCNRSSPEVTFNDIPHLIPKLMGNRHLVSDYECDSCNHLFSNYEGALGNFIGIGRTLLSIKGKKGVPKFKDRDEKLVAKKDDTGVLITTPAKWDKDYFEIDETGKSVTVKATTKPYKPIYVYKSLLKIAMGLLKEETIANYEQCKIFLQTDAHDSKVKGNPYLNLFTYYVPGPSLSFPLAFILRKRKERESSKVPYRMMVLQFSNFVYQIFLPFGIEDKDINQIGNTFQLNIFPPMVELDQIKKFGMPQLKQIDLSSSELINASQSATMIFDQSTIS